MRAPSRINAPLATQSKRETASEQLAELLAGVWRRNDCGTHLLVRQELREPACIKPGLQSVRLLFRDAPEEAADPSQWLFLDIETTGLSGGTGTYAFLVGLAWWQSDGLVIEQFFMRDHSEEPSLLLELSRRLAERRVLVTFNGKTFDWPLIKTRCRMTRAVATPAPRAHLDLLYPARQLWRHRLGSVRLIELERQVLAIRRGYDIPSELIPRLYFNYLRGGPPGPISHVFRHNQMDLQGVAALARRVLSIVEGSGGTQEDPLDLYGLSRLLDRRGAVTLARSAYERALRTGLPVALDRSAREGLARLAKRERDFERATSLWKELLSRSIESLDAYEQLAILYEHRTREPERAREITLEAIEVLRDALKRGRVAADLFGRWNARLAYRLARLQSSLPGPLTGPVT